jgi:hypothetical protein
MTVELVASSAPVPFLTKGINLNATGWHPFFCLDWSFVTAVLGKENYGKNYGKENEF